MRVLTYELSLPCGPEKRVGILLNNNEIFDPNWAYQNYFKENGYYDYKSMADRVCPTSLHTLLTEFENPLEILKRSLTLNTKSIINPKSIKLTSPLDKITSYRDFFTHLKHVEKGFQKRGEKVPEAWFEIPAYYKGATSGFIGNGDTIPWPCYTDFLDYELELAVVISRDGKNIKKEDALNHIFGFTILNDVSARDIQKKEMQIRLGPSKSKDFCSILGPVITTIDEFNFKEPNLLMTAKINGQEWSRGYSGDAHYTWAEMIAFASKEEWLRAGDLLGSGTVGTGCGLELDRFIKEGDLVELEIEGIGILSNRVGKKNHEKL